MGGCLLSSKAVVILTLMTRSVHFRSPTTYLPTHPHIHLPIPRCNMPISLVQLIWLSAAEALMMLRFEHSPSTVRPFAIATCSDHFIIRCGEPNLRNPPIVRIRALVLNSSKYTRSAVSGTRCCSSRAGEAGSRHPLHPLTKNVPLTARHGEEPVHFRPAQSEQI